MNPFDSSDLTKARDRLLHGDVVAMPTETVYGLAASIDSEKGLRKIFALKERPFFDPLIVHVGSFKQVKDLVLEWPPLADFVARMFWPGPLTIVVDKSERVNDLITSGLDTVALRYPAHPIAQDLIELAGVPLAAPSANKFGKTSPTSAEHVKEEFPNEDLLILDGGLSDVGVESTVIAIGKKGNRIEIYRPGAITKEMIESALKKWSGTVAVEFAHSPASPGHMKHHYMPKIPLAIVSAEEMDGLSPVTRKKVIAQTKIARINNALELRLDEDPAIAARELYSEMRRLADSGADVIYVKSMDPEERSGLWQAIWDRLSRAASLDLS
jgi:L-threonylcarbamoyladenylate synthase